MKRSSRRSPTASTPRPTGFDSATGVRNKAGAASEFADDEYVVYRTSQQRLDYLVEFTS
jgi:hypothetical protein